MLLGVIGTAGRGTDAAHLNANRWLVMQAKLQAVIADIQAKTGETVAGLVSGGAAWADHLAVRRFLEDPEHTLSLHLYFPCSWDFDRDQFQDTGVRDFRTNPGGTLNHYHRRFSQAVFPPSLQELGSVLSMRRCIWNVNRGGLHARNTNVAEESDAIVAFTFGDGPLLKDGGTADTMRKFKQFHPDGLAYHVDLHTMKAWRRPELPAAA